MTGRSSVEERGLARRIRRRGLTEGEVQEILADDLFEEHLGGLRRQRCLLQSRPVLAGPLEDERSVAVEREVGNRDPPLSRGCIVPDGDGLNDDQVRLLFELDRLVG